MSCMLKVWLNYNSGKVILIWYNHFIKWILIIDELLLSNIWLINITYETINDN
jgi:hypothetical protein